MTDFPSDGVNVVCKGCDGREFTKVFDEGVLVLECNGCGRRMSVMYNRSRFQDWLIIEALSNSGGHEHVEPIDD